MNFELTEEQRALQAMVREFAQREIAPQTKKYDESQEFPRGIMAKAGKLGLLGCLFPEEYGGAGLNYVDYVTVIEEISAVAGFERSQYGGLAPDVATQQCDATIAAELQD